MSAFFSLAFRGCESTSIIAPNSYDTTTTSTLNIVRNNYSQVGCVLDLLAYDTNPVMMELERTFIINSTSIVCIRPSIIFYIKHLFT